MKLLGMAKAVDEISCKSYHNTASSSHHARGELQARCHVKIQWKMSPCSCRSSAHCKTLHDIYIKKKKKKLALIVLVVSKETSYLL